MAKFKVLGGRHIDEDGREYKKGDTVESDKNLDTIYANKFQRLGEPTRVPRDRDDTLDHAGIVTDLPEHKRLKQMKGQDPHDDEEEVDIPTTVNTAAKTPSEIKHGVQKIDLSVLEEDEEETPEQTETEGAEGEEAPAFGKDVSDEFPKAGAAGMQVFRKGRDFTVVHKDAPGTALNGEPLKKDAVGKFIRSQSHKKASKE